MHILNNIHNASSIKDENYFLFYILRNVRHLTSNVCTLLTIRGSFEELIIEEQRHGLISWSWEKGRYVLTICLHFFHCAPRHSLQAEFVESINLTCKIWDKISPKTAILLCREAFNLCFIFKKWQYSWKLIYLIFKQKGGNNL